jgi:transcriptional regulator with XRE-family HTH domain
MAILRSRVAWTKPRPQNETRRSSDLTPVEQANVKRALRVLSARLGSLAALATALRVNPHTLRWYWQKRGKPTAGVALRAARLAAVPLEELLAGRWPVEGACPHCGRT